jgi:flagellar biosynthetic protein FliR
MTIDAMAIEAFLLALVRSSTWAISVPLLGGRGVASWGRLALAVSLALFLAPTVAAAGPLPTTTGGLIAAALVQAGIGLALGWLVGLLVSAFAVSGVMVDFLGGFSAGSIYNPISGNVGAVFSRFNEAAFALLLFVTPAFSSIIRGFVASFEAIPVGTTPTIDDRLPMTVASALGRMFVAALQIGAPVLGALFLTEVALGLAARFVPQANVFMVGLPLKAIVTFTTFGTALVFYPSYVQRLVDGGLVLSSKVLTG